MRLKCITLAFIFKMNSLILDLDFLIMNSEIYTILQTNEDETISSGKNWRLAERHLKTRKTTLFPFIYFDTLSAQDYRYITV